MHRTQDRKPKTQNAKRIPQYPRSAARSPKPIVPSPKRALFIGRFQPFHKGHFQVLQKLLKEYRQVIVVIGSAEKISSLENPFTAGERIEMIRRCFPHEQLARLLLVPVRDINDHSLWVSHLRSYLPSFHTVYSNNELVEVLFAKSGIQIKKFDLLIRSKYQGKIIRERILKNKSWKNALPAAVAHFIRQIRGMERLQKLFIARP